MVLPIVPVPSIQAIGGVATMSDILFLAKKKFDGKLISLNSTSDETTTGVKLTRTVPNGNTFYLGFVQITPMNTPVDLVSSTSWRATAAIKFDGVIVDTVGYTGYTEQGAGEGPGMGISGAGLKSNQTGISMDGNGIRTVEVDLTNLVGASHAVRLSLIGWEETTGTDPRI